MTTEKKMSKLATKLLALLGSSASPKFSFNQVCTVLALRLFHEIEAAMFSLIAAIEACSPALKIAWCRLTNSSTYKLKIVSVNYLYTTGSRSLHNRRNSRHTCTLRRVSFR